MICRSSDVPPVVDSDSHNVEVNHVALHDGRDAGSLVWLFPVGPFHPVH